MTLSFALFVALLLGLIVFLFIRAGKRREKGNGASDGGFTYDSDNHCSDAGDCGGGDGGGGD